VTKESLAEIRPQKPFLTRAGKKLKFADFDYRWSGRPSVVPDPKVARSSHPAEAELLEVFAFEALALG